MTTKRIGAIAALVALVGCVTMDPGRFEIENTDRVDAWIEISVTSDDREHVNWTGALERISPFCESLGYNRARAGGWLTRCLTSGNDECSRWIHNRIYRCTH
ncbi:MAG: hypothetical protein OXG25_01130 [Gammaproteobacteria bacterium]|nr:hypothetical protein [Gammaproteobacteria bacterium]